MSGGMKELGLGSRAAFCSFRDYPVVCASTACRRVRWKVRIWRRRANGDEERDDELLFVFLLVRSMVSKRGPRPSSAQAQATKALDSMTRTTDNAYH